MTTTHDTNPTESASTFYDPDPTESVRADNEPQTTASAWSSSPLGQLDHERRLDVADSPDTDAGEQRIAKHAIVAGALACGITGGVALALMLFDTTPNQPTVVVPGVDTSPHSAVVVTEGRDVPTPETVVSVQETVVHPTVAGPAPSTVSPPPVQKSGTADPGTPPVASEPDTTVVVNIPVPDYPPLPEKPQEDPEPEPPQPPDVPDLDFKLPVPPEPKPDPPNFAPDLTLAPFPQPQPDPPGPLIFVPPVKAGP
jgi:hypothetical protein